MRNNCNHDKVYASVWRDRLAALRARIAAEKITLMEVCGTHTHAIAEYALRRLLPP